MSAAGNTSSTKHIPLRVEPASSGGFIVSEAWTSDLGRMNPVLLACTTIGEALDFIKGRLAPADVKPAAVGAIGGIGCGCLACRSDREGHRYDYAVKKPVASAGLG